MKINMDKKYGTRDGQSVRLLCTDRDAGLPVVALMGDNAALETFTAEGRFHSLSVHPHDLVEVREWVDLEIDDTVMVRQGRGFWVKGYFAGLSVTGRPQTWDNGRTSWTEEGVGSWDECRRPTEERDQREGKNQLQKYRSIK